jgi:hypothetical protein
MFKDLIRREIYYFLKCFGSKLGLGLNQHAAASHNSDNTVNNESTVHHGTVRADASMLAQQMNTHTNQCPIGPVTVAPDQATSGSCSSHYEDAAMDKDENRTEISRSEPYYFLYFI